MTNTERPRLTKTREGYETTIGRRVYRVRPNIDPSTDGRWIVTYGPTWGEYDLSATPFASLADVREHLAYVAETDAE